MSDFFIIAERPVGGTNIFAVDEALTRCVPVGAKERSGRAPMWYLDGLPREAGVRPLTEFISEDAESVGWRIAAKGGGELPPGGLPPEQWFPATDGLAIVRGVLDDLTTHTEKVAEVRRVIGELRQLEKLLSRLEKEGILWHLEDGSWW